MDKILTVNDVAQILQVKAITVREMFREKRLRGFKVGKSWRTTEVMLTEDIDALARGESPAILPTPASPATASDSTPEADTPKSAPGPAPKPAPKSAPGKSPAPTPAEKKPAVPARRDKESDDDDTQQLLF